MIDERIPNQVYQMDCRKLLAGLPDASIDSVIADPMYGVGKPGPRASYDWGVDPAQGDPDKWWEYHRTILEHCRRVLKPGGTLAWAMGYKFHERFSEWFGGNRIWAFSRYKKQGINSFGHIWIVQTQEQQPIRFPDKDALIVMETKPELLRLHPCPKAINEMLFMVDALTTPGQIVLDPFCGTGTTLVAAALLKRKYIGCDLSERYCRVAKMRLAEINRTRTDDDNAA